MKNESDLRAWLRNSWSEENPPLTWIEAAVGGTFGAPDVLVPLGGSKFLPLELKFWKPYKKVAMHVSIRVPQRRWHRMALRKGSRSAFLVATEYDEGPYLFPAEKVLKKQFVLPPVRGPVFCADDIVKLALSEEFWK